MYILLFAAYFAVLENKSKLLRSLYYLYVFLYVFYKQ
jgi:hypothetical protein